jgi:hypothetical protein
MMHVVRRIRDTRTMCEKKTELLNIMEAGTYKCQCVLKGYFP